MRWLINYIRQCFCKHEFEREEVNIYSDDSVTRPTKIRVHMICNKCGYHIKFKK